MKTNATFYLLALLFSLGLSINVPTCAKGGVNINFKDQDGSYDPTTFANMCHDDQDLYVSWENIDKSIVSTFTKCNDKLYLQDAVEIFIATMKGYPQIYYQIQLSPKGVLFFYDMTNPSGNCDNFDGTPKDCSPLQGSAQIFPNGWKANLKVNLSYVESDSFYANIFRLDYTKDCKEIRYLAMNPTGTPKPCFHVPSKFEKFVLV